MKFIKCEDCEQVALILTEDENGVCSGSENELTANTTDAATEKHVPYVTRDGDILTVQVGSVEHPMLEEHHIAWIYVETKAGGMLKNLKVGAKPVATFNVSNEEVVAVYEYCNLHGLWKVEV